MKKLGLLCMVSMTIGFGAMQAQDENETRDQNFELFQEEMRKGMNGFSFYFDTSFIMRDTMIWDAFDNMQSFNFEEPMKMLEEMMKGMEMDKDWESMLKPFFEDFDIKEFQPPGGQAPFDFGPADKKKRKVYTL